MKGLNVFHGLMAVFAALLPVMARANPGHSMAGHTMAGHTMAGHTMGGHVGMAPRVSGGHRGMRR